MQVDKFYLYHGCHSLTNQISQLEVGNFHNHLLGGGYENNHLCLWRCSSYKAKRAYFNK